MARSKTSNTANGVNGHANANANTTTTITAVNSTATSSGLATPFTPIHQGVRDGVGDLARLLSEAQKHIDNINSASEEMKSPTMDALLEDISSLSGEIDGARSSHSVKVEEVKMRVEHKLKFEIAEILSAQFKSQIIQDIKLQVKAEVRDWNSQTQLGDGLKKVLVDNETVFRNAKARLNNSQARRENSTFDEIYNFDDKLHVVWNSNGEKSDLYPDSLRHLFRYNDAQVERLLQFYDLRDCGNKIDNLNRFLAFIGLRFVIPNQAAIPWGEKEEAVGTKVTDAIVKTEKGKTEETEKGKKNEVKKDEKKTEVEKNDKVVAEKEKDTKVEEDGKGVEGGMDKKDAGANGKNAKVENGEKKAESQDDNTEEKKSEPPKKPDERKTWIQNQQLRNGVNQHSQGQGPRVSSPTFNRSAPAWPSPASTNAKRQSTGPPDRGATLPNLPGDIEKGPARAGEGWLPSWMS